MTVIKILLHTIRENPDYTPSGIVHILPGKETVTVYSPKRLPKSIEDKFICCNSSHQMDRENGMIETDFIYVLKGKLTPHLTNVLKRLDGAVVSMERAVVHVQSGYEPQYLYQYANPSLKCSECGNMVKFKDIKFTFLVTDDDEYNADECPICGEKNTFDYTLETIDRALIRKGFK